VLAALVIWRAHLGWDLFGGDAADLALTLVWVVGLVNAFNLMDNLDGASGTVATVSALGAGLLAADQGAVLLGAFSVALAGGCLGFLRYNLAAPSRIFLGDGGSMPIGFLLAVIVMQIPHPSFGWITLLAAAPIVGLVIFDTTLVVVSRVRRGAPVLSGARDHLSHRLLALAGTPQRVALILAAAQALLCCAGALLYRQQEAVVVAAGGSFVVLALVWIGVIETFSAAPAHAPERVLPAPAREWT
jgi:UDP-GlcNAc:undecaprenyl-phosphate GlcNAc-1-phosphate transferase